MSDLRVWKSMMEGGAVTPLNANKPVCGYWRYRMGGPWHRVAIWEADGHLVATDNEAEIDPLVVWGRILSAPTGTPIAVSWEAFQEHEKTGRFPPDRLHNEPPQPVEDVPDKDAVYRGIVEKANALFAKTNEVLDQGPTADENAAAALAKDLTALAGEAEKQHGEEKRPWLEGGRKIDDRWAFSKDLRNASADIKTRVLTPILNAQKAKALAEAKAQQEAERKRQEAEWLATRPKPGDTPPEPPPAVLEPPAPIKAGIGRKKVALKEVEVVEITDYLEFVKWLLTAGDVDLQEFLAKRATQLLRGGVRNAAGTKIKMESVAK